MALRDIGRRKQAGVFGTRVVLAVAAAVTAAVLAAGDGSAATLGGLTSATLTSASWAGPAPSACEDVSAWSAAAVYTTGDTVTYNGSLWQAQWWTRGFAPEPTYGPWVQVDTCAPGGGTTGPTNPAQPACSSSPWYPSTIYNTGDTVVYNGAAWQAKWWTRGQTPGGPYGPWQELYTCTPAGP